MILTGLCRLGRDAMMRQLQDGTDVANLALAYNFGKKDQDGKRQTQWIDASLWGDRAAKLAPYLLKGTQISVVLDDVHGEKWEKQDGSSGFSLRGHVSQIEFGSKPAEKRTEPTTQPKAAAKPASSGGSFADMEDDIPF